MNSPLLGVVAVEALLASGVRHVLLSPGSRNAPLSLALHAADEAGLLTLHVRIDERVAGFIALGIAKASRSPVAVVTTSGTAVGNLLPAVMEARASGIPLVLLTADRPAHAVGTGANQTTDQVGLFGAQVLGTVRMSSSSGDERSWWGQLTRAVALATGIRTRLPGPVHVNVEFDLPLVDATVRPPAAQPPRPVLASSSGVSVHEVTTPARTVILAGDAPPAVGAEARALARIARVPLLAEPSSNARSGDAVPRYREQLARLGPEIERVVVFGHPTLSRPVTALLSRDDVEVIVVADRADWVDPGHVAARVVDRVLLPEGDPDWYHRWDRGVPEPTGLTFEAVAAAVVRAVGPGEHLVFGASSSIRHADVAPVPEHPGTCHANRGLAGIDGTLATATGIALATGAPTTVLLGDLTLQHDLGALVLPPSEPTIDLRVILVDDDGGSIFGQLEQGAPEFRRAFDRVFRAPQGVDCSEAALTFGWKVDNVRSLAALESRLRCGFSGRELLRVVPAAG
ncbi:2-succinyl-5-enolpyruvyl-6-hydroxy-3-cyclohexene-1-carboxylic-acid synthase [Arachnia propionica]|uniref:2-succinyl-5-enolpyruvyl-6-hydroxy-3-cyclohexene-1-carboxylate synthase n=1 Tax=Arachnia propionica TaxID=1750 RepID=A0A3P1WUR7_9ACTN|nr:2-succinyl-5-enolpyruvyl-6-hydroxy-3-cyclohexene-1-carboxylic-acid synthase [Arachnia propionica]RRD49985.1 2-succinyl-5-enolpyruvyl-6-hydroxy-3-cyclohexene-1-carboxylic-acid synthase [Arachnia propionica]